MISLSAIVTIDPSFFPYFSFLSNFIHSLIRKNKFSLKELFVNNFINKFI